MEEAYSGSQDCFPKPISYICTTGIALVPFQILSLPFCIVVLWFKGHGGAAWEKWNKHWLIASCVHDLVLICMISCTLNHPAVPTWVSAQVLTGMEGCKLRLTLKAKSQHGAALPRWSQVRYPSSLGLWVITGSAKTGSAIAFPSNCCVWSRDSLCNC